MPLALTDNQLDLVTRAAALLPLHDRDHFLRSISNRIGDVANPDDTAVQDTVAFVLNCGGIGGGHAAFTHPHFNKKGNADDHQIR
jgi:hypothetical protein